MAHLHLGKVFGVSGLTALVSGGGTGIGLMMAKGLAANGAKVYIGGRRKEVVEKASAEHGAGLSGKILPAGQVGPVSKFFSIPSAPERKDTETLGTALFKNESFQACLGLLERASKAREAETGGWSSSIIGISSISGQMKQAQDHVSLVHLIKPDRVLFAYNASKAAGIHLTKMLSTELALRNIPVRVNSISPGAFPSEMTSMEGSAFTAKNVDLVGKGISKVPSARGGLDKDIVGAALYLASPASHYVNGQIITVDGGFISVNPSSETGNDLTLTKQLGLPMVEARSRFVAVRILKLHYDNLQAMDRLQLDKIFAVSGLTVLWADDGQGLAANGAKVYIGGRRKETVEKAAEEQGNGLSGSLIPISLDVTSKESIENAVKLISSENDGKLDVLINNAGQVGPASRFFSNPDVPERKDTETLGTALFRNESFEEWSDLFSVNVSSIFFVSTAFLGLLENASKTRETETGDGVPRSLTSQFAYNASKAAGIHLTKMLSTELALRKIPIRVNTISPGPFPTEMTGSEGSTIPADVVELITKGITKVPSSRGGLDKDIVGAVVYLASPASYYVNGQVITVDGGFLAVNPAVA
ncbi:Enoyl-(Acyl carrier protein) reductase [Rhizoctonia solani]|uniref:Enoyl-(Acyl carrier protein) reductase n=1 Tax=Rhizoctonia solani TaxID=456999 RepID=A0A8H7M588_9AGAM|nr:Enoyl-(Acyl carrier protein) reductase [Rhizoctonia solani]